MPPNDRPGAPSVAPAVDVWGIVAAIACAAHCLAAPLALAALPLALAAWLEHPALEWGLVALSLGLSGAAIGRGARRHRRWHLLPLLAAGVALLLAPRLHPDIGEPTERAVIGVGATLLVITHLLNLRRPARL